MTGPELVAEILARNIDGAEYRMKVSHNLLGEGLVVLTDDGMTRILSVGAALGLASELIRAAIRHRQLSGPPGPMSSTF